MTRTAEGATLAILDKLEPEAKAGWEEEVLNLPEAIAASQAMTDRRRALAVETSTQAEKDARTIELATIDPAIRDTLDPGLRGRYELLEPQQ